MAAEAAGDESLATAARLLNRTLELRKSAGLPAATSQLALEQIGASIASQLEGRKSVLAAHAEFGRIAHGLGATPTAWGPAWPCPDSATAKPAHAPRNLRAVAAA